jgi:hypothetical protein
MRKRTKFYLGLIILLVAVILLTVLVLQGPHTRIPETNLDLLHDHPNGPSLSDMKPDDKVELKFEASKPVNVILMREADSGKYFVLEERTGFEYYQLASEETAGSLKHTFDSDGDWKIYFEGTGVPGPSASNPTVKYWGEIIREEDDLFFYYLNIIVCIILIILGLLLLNSSRTVRSKSKKSTQKKKK